MPGSKTSSGQVAAFFKALADESRISILSLVIERPRYVEELAALTGLSASTVSFHLKKLEAVHLVTAQKEQYYVTYTPRLELLRRAVIHFIQCGPREQRSQAEREARYRDKVLRTFIKYGKLQKIPVQHKKRVLILEYLVERFELGRRYSEREVNLSVADFFDDFATLRRACVDEGLLKRESGNYWRSEKGRTDDGFNHAAADL